MTDTLKDSCDAILRRLQNNDVTNYKCILCPLQQCGQDACMEHYILVHQIHPVHFDNIVDLDKFFSFLSSLVHKEGDENFTCPVCGTGELADLSAFEAHILEEKHNYWDTKTIPSLSDFCVAAQTDSDDEAEAEDNNNAVPDENEEDEDFSDSQEDVECLYCASHSEDILGHFKEHHNFDLRDLIAKRSDIKDEYDLIRIANLVRRSIASGRCPFSFSESSETETCDLAIKEEGGLEEHLLKFPEHRLPSTIPEGESYLIPVIPGDSFISLLVSSGDSLLSSAPEDPDYPLVPTIYEMSSSKK